MTEQSRPKLEAEARRTALKAILTQGAGSLQVWAQLSAWEQRRTFEASLRDALKQSGIDFVSAEAVGGELPFWKVTVSTRLRGVQTFKASLIPGWPHYSLDTLGNLLARVREACLPSTQEPRK